MDSDKKRVSCSSSNQSSRRYSNVAIIVTSVDNDGYSSNIFNPEAKTVLSFDKSKLHVSCESRSGASLSLHRSSAASNKPMMDRSLSRSCRHRSTSRVHRKSMNKKRSNEKNVCAYPRSSKSKSVEHLEHYYNLSVPFVSDDKSEPRLADGRSLIYQNRQLVELPRRKTLPSESEHRDCCLYCQRWYDINNNPRGSCSEAPDSAESFIRKITCYPLAQAAVYHCCRENDEVQAKIGRYGNGYECQTNKCLVKQVIRQMSCRANIAGQTSCRAKKKLSTKRVSSNQADTRKCYIVVKSSRNSFICHFQIHVQNVFSHTSNSVPLIKRLKRWLLFLVLTLFAPCLCCYLPAKGIYRCLRPKRGCHKPSGQRSTAPTSSCYDRRRSLQLF